jgi:S-adenosylmethionine synthetase
LGGPVADVGQTGRKIVSDAYGDTAYSGGSAFSGKDPSKTDRSASYLARMMAKHVVAGGFAERCLVQLAYAFGVSEPIAFDIETYGTEKVEKERIKEALREIFPTEPKEDDRVFGPKKAHLQKDRLLRTLWQRGAPLGKAN